MVESNFGLPKSQKRVVYLVISSLVVAMFFVLLYLVILFANTKTALFSFNETAEKTVGLVFLVAGGMVGRPVGEKWWHMVYEKRKKGMFFKVN